jgi:hypothetical protein
MATGEAKEYCRYEKLTRTHYLVEGVGAGVDGVVVL